MKRLISKFLNFCIFTFLLIVIFHFSSFSQEKKEDTTGVDYLFKKAQNLAYNHKRAEARKICYSILEKSPNYSDVRILIGRTYEWDNKPDSARIELKKVINKGYYEDAYSALLDVETWENRVDTALYYADVILQHEPNNEVILLKKAKLLIKKGDEAGAVTILNQMLVNNPANKDAKDLLESVKVSKLSNRIDVGWSNQYFDQSSWSHSDWDRNWNIYSIDYCHRYSSFGLVQYFANFGTLNDHTSQGRPAYVDKQFEIDAYPGLTRHSYLYLSYAYSPDDDLFPRHHATAELYYSFPKGWEASLGMTYMEFHSSSGASQVYMYTASVSKYIGNYWLDLRGYLIPDKQLRNVTSNTLMTFSESLHFTVRRYFSSATDFVYLTLGFGESPIKYDYDINVEIDKTQNIGIGYQKLFKKRFFFTASIGLYHEEYFPISNEYRYEIDSSISLGYYF